MNNKLFLIDGHALIFKMYYAFLRRPMINSKGQDTSILFGFTKYILELIAKEKPSHIAIAFDPPGKTFRHELYPEYKGTRSETPQLIIDSLEPLIEICETMNIPVLMKSGFEADDIIGSMAVRSGSEDLNVYMVTPDKDYGQLITKNIFQYKPGKAGSDVELVDYQAICEKYKISEPKQVIDMLAICGDSSDNVIGVKGVGEVGASKLIMKYGTLKNIYSHIDELTPKMKAAFEDASSYIELSKTLVTIKTDIVLETTTKDMEFDTNFSPKIVELFENYEFGSLGRHIGHIEAEKKEETFEELNWDEIPLKEIILKISQAKKCSLLIDETKLNVGLSSEGKNFFSHGKISDFNIILEDKSITKIGYDFKNQCNILSDKGIALKGKFLDIELMHYLINPEKSHKLDVLSKSYLNINAASTNPVAAQSLSLFDEGPSENKEQSFAKETIITALLGEKIYSELEELKLTDLYNNIEEPLIRVLSRMECVGVKIDTKQLKDFAKELNTELDLCGERIKEMADEPNLNISSPKQVGIVLFEKLGLDEKIRSKNASKRSYPTDEETLNSISDRHPIVNKILEFRGVKKLLSTYIEPFPTYISAKTGRVHTTFNQALTATGRLSSSKPNLQNIPIRTERGKEIRKAFIAENGDGLLLSADYSQIELRIMAHLCCDEHLVEAFNKGVDVHTSTAAKIFNISEEEVSSEQRRIAKTANFGIMYGISPFGLSQRLGISVKEAKKIIEDYFASFPAVASFIESTKLTAQENLYVETLFGRRRYLPDINSKNTVVRSLSERNAINAPIQGSSADIIKLAMINVDKKIIESGLRSKMVLQIHDELVFETYPEEVERLKDIVVEEMQNVVKLNIPLIVDCNYGKNWLEAH